MKLSGESRIRGYLYVFERSLRSFLSPAVAADAVREVESHIRDAVTEAGDVPDEHAALEGILRRLGPPMRVAQAYSLELVMDEAAATGRLTSVLRSLFHAATIGVIAFVAAFGLFVGYSMGIAFVVIPMMKPIFPNNVGFWMSQTACLCPARQFPIGSRGSRVPYELLDHSWRPFNRLRAAACHPRSRTALDRVVRNRRKWRPRANLFPSC